MEPLAAAQAPQAAPANGCPAERAGGGEAALPRADQARPGSLLRWTRPSKRPAGRRRLLHRLALSVLVHALAAAALLWAHRDALSGAAVSAGPLEFSAAVEAPEEVPPEAPPLEEPTLTVPQEEPLLAEPVLEPAVVETWETLPDTDLAERLEDLDVVVERPALLDPAPRPRPPPVEPAPPSPPRAASPPPRPAAPTPPRAATPLRLLAGPQPPYPPEALGLGLEGRVLLELLVGPEGAVRSARVVASSGHAVLDETARRWVVARWLFAPGPGDRRTEVAVSFRLR